ncbi:MAG: hypothetical protein HRU09_14455 [Oligoflexales bacterium]|nr:hypothetical protein [Oligoflexales bacterium]
MTVRLPRMNMKRRIVLTQLSLICLIFSGLSVVKAEEAKVPSKDDLQIRDWFALGSGCKVTPNKCPTH